MAVFLTEVIVLYLLLLIIFVINLALFNSVVSRLFKTADSCIKWIIFIHIGPVLILQIATSVLSALKSEDDLYGTISDVISYIGTVALPGFGFNDGLGFINTLPNTTSISDALSASDNKMTMNLGLSAACFAVYFLLGIITEIVNAFVTKSANEPLFAPPNEDPDVTAERVRIERADINQAMKDNTVVVRGVRKSFKRSGRSCRKPPPLVAVNNVSFGIHENDCFGLLGPNGAGKSTLINMITAELAATNGTVSVNGANISGWKHALYPQICLGRCLQDDALMGFLTPEQHIMIMGLIRCNSANRSIKADTDRALQDLELTSFANRPAETLSGGMCRKLSAALAMLPGCRLLVFDEPSTGMDPVTRRSLWNAISRQSHCVGRSVLLTTHSMEEAETLCGTLGIVIHGLMQCFGNVQHLKARYSSGYRVMLEFTEQSDIPACEEMLRGILRKDSEQHTPSGTTTTTTTTPAGFDQAVATLSDELVKSVDTNGLRHTYAIPRPGRLSYLFTMLEQNCPKFHINSYAIYQATLEDVFMSLVRESDPEQTAVNVTLES